MDGEGGADGGALAERVEATASDDDDGECAGGGGGATAGGGGCGGGGGASAAAGGGEVVSLVACAHGAWVREPAVALCVAELRLEAVSEQQVAGDV